MTALRDASELLWPAVAETLASLDLGSEHAAAAKLAKRYAQVIDEMPEHAPRGQPNQAWGLRWIGPLLLDCLTELGATPAATARLKGGKQAEPAAKSQLDKLREARASRRG
jgi:hypothetical protein